MVAAPGASAARRQPVRARQPSVAQRPSVARPLARAPKAVAATPLQAERGPAPESCRSIARARARTNIPRMLPPSFPTPATYSSKYASAQIPNHSAGSAVS